MKAPILLADLSPEYQTLAARAESYLTAVRWLVQQAGLSFFVSGVAVALSVIESAIRSRGAS